MLYASLLITLSLAICHLLKDKRVWRIEHLLPKPNIFLYALETVKGKQRRATDKPMGLIDLTILFMEFDGIADGSAL